jgi:hypothetical protein
MYRHKVYKSCIISSIHMTMTRTKKLIVGSAVVILLLLLYTVSINNSLAPTITQSQGTTSLPNSGEIGQPSTSGGMVSTSTETACTTQGGTWNAQYKECTGINEPTCTSLGGGYNGCASACRHASNAEICTEMCVQVCAFK